MGEPVNRVIVYHGMYGCETGCCGHWVDLGDRKKLMFGHYGHYDGQEPAETSREYAERIIREMYGDEHVADLDWEHSKIVSYEECVL